MEPDGYLDVEGTLKGLEERREVQSIVPKV